jgi:hypothetical protein
MILPELLKLEQDIPADIQKSLIQIRADYIRSYPNFPEEHLDDCMLLLREHLVEIAKISDPQNPLKAVRQYKAIREKFDKEYQKFLKARNISLSGRNRTL